MNNHRPTDHPTDDRRTGEVIGKLHSQQGYGPEVVGIVLLLWTVEVELLGDGSLLVDADVEEHGRHAERHVLYLPRQNNMKRSCSSPATPEQYETGSKAVESGL